jgi:drug/metabolite transporter (DMT)-like permease
LLALARLRRLPLRLDARTHAWLALQGMSLYGLNYVLVYLTETRMNSGLVAMMFSLVVVFNIIFLRLMFGVPLSLRAMVGAAFGMAGLIVLFWPDLAGVSPSATTLSGLGYGLIGTIASSLGTMVATRNHRRGLAVIPGNAWAMGYGALFVAIYAWLDGQSFVFDVSFAYIASWLYLALFGTVIAFVAYLTLMGRIGADRAGYSAIATPVVAMGLSTVFERLAWNAWIVAGMSLCLAGNVIAMGLVSRLPRRRARSPQQV